MEPITILVVLLSLQGICHGEALADPKAAHHRYVPPINGIYDTPTTPKTPHNSCEYSTKTVTTTIPVTETMTMSGITDTRTMPAQTAFSNIPPVTTTLLTYSTTTKPQVTNTIWTQYHIDSQLSTVTVTSTIPVFTTVTLERLTETTTVEETIRETMMLVTSTIVRTSIVTEQPVVSVIVQPGNVKPVTLLSKTIYSTIPIISTMEMPHCCTSTKTTKMNVWTTLPADTTHYTPTVHAPPITIIHTSVSTKVEYTKQDDTTIYHTKVVTVRTKCGGYTYTTPAVQFDHHTTRVHQHAPASGSSRTSSSHSSGSGFFITKDGKKIRTK